MTQKIKKFIADLAIVKWLVQRSRKIILPGFQGLNLYTVLRFFIRGLNKGDILNRASSVCFNLILAFFPTLILILTLIPYVPIENFQESILQKVEELSPGDTYSVISGTINDLINQKYSTLLSIGFVLSFFYASNSINAILTGFSKSYNLMVTRDPIRQRLAACALLSLLFILIVLAEVVVIADNWLISYLKEIQFMDNPFFIGFLRILSWIIDFFIFNFGISLLYNFGQPQRKKWKFFTPGSLLTSVFCILASVIFAWYINNFASYNKLYGSLGTILVLLIFLYYNVVILMIGFDLNTSITRAKRVQEEKANL